MMARCHPLSKLGALSISLDVAFILGIFWHNCAPILGPQGSRALLEESSGNFEQHHLAQTLMFLTCPKKENLSQDLYRGFLLVNDTPSSVHNSVPNSAPNSAPYRHPIRHPIGTLSTPTSAPNRHPQSALNS